MIPFASFVAGAVIASLVWMLLPSSKRSVATLLTAPTYNCATRELTIGGLSASDPPVNAIWALVELGTNMPTPDFRDIFDPKSGVQYKKVTAGTEVLTLSTWPTTGDGPYTAHFWLDYGQSPSKFSDECPSSSSSSSARGSVSSSASRG